MEFDPGLLNGFFGSCQRELREPVIQAHLLAVKATFGLEPAHLTANLDGKAVYIAKFELGNPAAPFAHGL